MRGSRPDRHLPRSGLAQWSPGAPTPSGPDRATNSTTKAFDHARPGDVIVVNGSGDDTPALIGDLIGIRAKSLAIAGFVIGGAVRDADALAELGLPVFARCVTPAGPYNDGPSRLSEPLALRGFVAYSCDGAPPTQTEWSSSRVRMWTT
ncbi:hypothetical protein [Rhodococcus sp. BS-15]|uniref:RraA family protein n=1 Tax=Rhodococcus sp. BS-15 TaxID=1304954 RepID=UPI000B0A96BC|nr:hypothetical protein [Rhodococcus sp. BS-15]